MRVIGGEFRSRRLKALPGNAVRPTPDRLREALFNVLAPRLEGRTFLDAYAGSGAVGIEALSRGAARAVFLERHRPAALLIEQNLASIGARSRALVVCAPALKHLERVAADIVFLDPPYNLEREYRQALAKLGANPPGLVIVQHDVRLELKEAYGSLVRTRSLRQGDNALTFFEPASACRRSGSPE
ncbi:MAG TPA: 16S rRNA (guanine(966)-N(2))-methyltransferase RsmD [Bryobacteraceae bacterium]|nr:16S rRNA (guanine(966)-N(2))-methyltransferase RsmD [Bryobacteraceae bacterium]